MAGETTPPAISSFQCQACGAPITIRAKGLSVTAVCASCGSLSENDNGDFKLVQKSIEAMKITPLLTLGAKGRIRGHIYQFIGFMRRFEKEYPSEPWDEYLLFNPFAGYCWLVESKGHWTLFKSTKNTPKSIYDGSLEFLGDTYKIFHQGNAVVQFVVGEFYWQVRIGNTVKTLDAISPPHMLSQEQDGQEIIWSLGEYIEPAEVRAAFHPAALPNREGVAPNQPAQTKSLNSMLASWFLVIFILLMAQLFGTSLRPEKPLGGHKVTVTPTGVTDVEIEKFSTEGSSTQVTVTLNAALKQSWTSVNLRVAPEDPSQTGAHSFEKDLSFYSGYEDGEYWSEGSAQAEFLVNALPRGHYRVLLTAMPEAGHSVDISAWVTIAPAVWANFWLAILLISLPPVWMIFRSGSFERNRWKDSEYNPFDKSGGS